jgi:AraC-like DNA-binding protein
MKLASIHHSEVFGSPWPGLFRTRIESDRHYGKHAHATFGIGQVERGAQDSTSGRGQVRAAAGDVITTNPGEVHDGHPVGGRPRRWQMIYAEPEVFSALSDAEHDIDRTRLELTRPVVSDARCARVVRDLFDALDDWLAVKCSSGARAESLACEASFVRASTLLLGQAAASVARDKRDIAIRRVRERIADDLLAPPTLTEMAVASGLSKYQLLRRFEATYGLPPHRWLLQCRVERARGLIAAGTGIADAAFASGFADQSHLNRHFTQQLGFTPGAWRRAALQ